MIFSIDDSSRQNRPALIDAESGVVWLYRDLVREISLRSELLRRPGKGLLLHFCGNDFDSVAWYLAAIESGHAVALLNGSMNAELRSGLIAAYRPEWVRCLSQPSEDRYAFEPRSTLWVSSEGEEAPIHSDLSLLLSTSGSTGSPKFVRLSRRNFESNAAAICEILDISQEDCPVAHLPIHYSYGMSVLNSHLLAGAPILLTSEGLLSPAFWEAIRKHRVNSFSGVPYTYQMLKRLRLDALNVPLLRTMTQAGGKLDQANIEWFHSQMIERGGSFYVMYGQTEASPRIATLPSRDLPRKPGSAGRALPGGALSILTQEAVCSTGPNVEGELVYRGPNVMMGYAEERSHLERGDELEGCLHTGDRARLDEEGFVYILGRARRDAKLFGLRVNLDELEAMVRPHGPAAAVASPRGVVVFCEFGSEAEHASIRDSLAEKLQIHRSGFDFRRISKIPTKASGKIDYDKLVAGL